MGDWEEFMASKQTDNKTGNKKTRGFITPDRYTPAWQSTRLDAAGNLLESGVEVQIDNWSEPQQVVGPQQASAAPPPPVVADPTSTEWQIEAMAMQGSRVLSVQAYHPGQERTIDFNMEAYFESGVNRSEVANALRSLVRLYEGEGVEIRHPRRAPKPELIEEMYQLLSIIMEDPVLSRYAQQWATVRTQVESQ